MLCHNDKGSTEMNVCMCVLGCVSVRTLVICVVVVVHKDSEVIV